MARFHTLSTTLNDGKTQASAVPITRLEVCKAKADAAGDPSLCKRQTIQVKEGLPTSYRIVETLARISAAGRWSGWMIADPHAEDPA